MQEPIEYSFKMHEKGFMCVYDDSTTTPMRYRDSTTIPCVLYRLDHCRSY